MNLIFSSVLVITILQIVLCSGLKWRLLCRLVLIICRVLFLMRAFGIVFKIKGMRIAELLNIGFQIVLGVLWPNNYSWVALIVFTLLDLLSMFLEWLDDKFYIYTVEDVKDERRRK